MIEKRVTVGRGSCGIAAGADLALGFLADNGVKARSVGCVGLCYLEPIVEVYDGGSRKTFVRVDETGVAEIAKLVSGKENNAEAYAIDPCDKAFIEDGNRIVLKRCGVIDPDEIEEYGDYAAFRRVLQLTPEETIETVKQAGLLGRGGAGFPTWFKWDAARKSPGTKKYIICNADEGDPGAFMDRAIIEGDPHALIEGMIIAAYAIGSGHAETSGIVYVRAEYPLAIKRLRRAIDQAHWKGFLGENILGSGFSFDLRIKEGAGAFVCGEETALIASIEGERGMPRLKPPFPAQKGLWGLPTNINNVETYANVPFILQNGAGAFNTIGTEQSKGTKVFALTGKIAKGGLVEAPMGKSLRDDMYGPGGGVRDGKAFKAVQLGGPSGGCVPEDLLDTVIDYRALQATGAIMGSGGMVVMDESTCMVDMARFFLDFVCKESCGKCVHCRVGTKRMLEVLTRIVDGEGREGDIELLVELGEQIREGALCGLGTTAPNPVLTTIKYFKNEFEDHIIQKKCTAKSCQALISYSINPSLCAGCTACKRQCPADAIEGEMRMPHVIDSAKCVKCGKCADACRFKAIEVN